MLDARNVTAIVVTYNRLPLLKQCLAALRAQTVQGFTVLLVDNASTDGTADYIKTLAMPGLVCRNPGENLGGAGGFAYGIRAAAELGCEAVWIMDDDTLPEPDALAALLGRRCRPRRRLRLAVQPGTRPGRHRPADEPAAQNDVPRY